MSTVKRVQLKDLAQAIENFSGAAIPMQKQAIRMGLIRSLPMLAERSPVDQGAYAASWDFTETERSMIIGNYAPHAPVIEFGARPFTPPLGPLLAWAKRVLKDPSQPPKYSNEVWALAVGTQKKIAREGMKPKHILTDALPAIIENIKAEFRRLS